MRITHATPLTRVHTHSTVTREICAYTYIGPLLHFFRSSPYTLVNTPSIRVQQHFNRADRIYTVYSFPFEILTVFLLCINRAKRSSPDDRLVKVDKKYGAAFKSTSMFESIFLSSFLARTFFESISDLY